MLKQLNTWRHRVLALWLVGRSVGWLAGWLVGWLVGWFCCACSSLPTQIWTGLSLSLELQLFMNPIKINFWWNCLTRYSRWSCCLFGFVLHSSLLYEPTAVSRCRSCHAGRTSASSWSARNYLTQRPKNVWSCDQFSRLSALWTAWTRSRGSLVFENTQKALRNTVYTAYTVYIYMICIMICTHRPALIYCWDVAKEDGVSTHANPGAS